MRRSKDLIEDHLGTACEHFAYPWAVGSAGRRPRGAAPLPDGGPRRVEDQPRRADRPVPARPRADPAERRPLLLPPQGSWRARHGGVALPGARARAVGESVRRRRGSPTSRPSTSRLRFLLLPQLRRAARCRVRRHDDQRAGSLGRRHRGRGHPPHPVASRDARVGPARRTSLAFRELLAIFRRERFDLVHTHNPKPGVMGRVAARMAGVPRVIEHGARALRDARGPAPAARPGAGGGVGRRALQRPGAVPVGRGPRVGAAPARDAARPIARTWATGSTSRAFTPELAGEERVREAPRRARDRRGRAGRRHGRPDGAREGLRRALRRPRAIVRARVPERAVPGGGGARSGQGGRRRRPTQIERAADDFVFAGWREDVADLMALMDVFVLPSWREGLPRSAIEAAASGLPLVLTDIRGCREVVRDGVEGFLVPVRDPRRLADAIVRLLEDPALRRRDGRGRARAGRGAVRRAARRGDRRRRDAGRCSARRPGGCRSRTTSGVQVRRARVGRRGGDGAAASGVDADRVPADAGRRGSSDGCTARRSPTPTRSALVADDGGRVVGFADRGPVGRRVLPQVRPPSRASRRASPPRRTRPALGAYGA